MLTDIFYAVVAALFNTISFVLSPLNFLIPPAFITSVLFFFNYLNYFNGIIDLPTLGYCINALLIFDSVWYSYQIVLFLIHLTPWVGNPSHPKANK